MTEETAFKFGISLNEDIFGLSFIFLQLIHPGIKELL